jgi:hypothetical protein
MTINVALVTSEAVVLGCDSIASSTRPYLDPLVFTQRDENGNFVQDEHGLMVAKFRFDDLQQVVTDSWGGVTKMFRLFDDGSPVAGVTAGLAQLKSRNISAIAAEFTRVSAHQPYYTADAVVNAFVAHIGAIYEQHYADSELPPALRDNVEFLIGGFGSDDNFPSLYRVNLVNQAGEQVRKIYGDGEGFGGRTGISWAGQSDGVVRLLFGYDHPLRAAIERDVAAGFDRLHQSMSTAAVRILTDTLAALDAQLPEGVNTDLPAKEELKLEWDGLRLSIDFANLPIQDAVDLVAYLVNLQSGKSKFVRGVPTVGGRTHIGIIDRNGFKMLNEPDLMHRNTGYARDI